MQDEYGEKVPTHDVTARNQQNFINKHIQSTTGIHFMVCTSVPCDTYRIRLTWKWYGKIYPKNHVGFGFGFFVTHLYA